jgi:ribonuclease G
MSKELVISASRHETRVAVIEDDQVVEVYYQRENEYSLAGSIHKGRVTRVLPGMQSAFVDIGLDRDAFLYVSDFFEDNDEYDKIVTSVEDKVFKLDKPPAGAPAPELAAPTGIAESAATDAAPVATAAPVAPMTAPMQEPRRDDRDNRGRRGRRRRGGRGRSGLPDSKFYSPGQRETQEDRPPASGQPVSGAPVLIPEALPQADADFEPETEAQAEAPARTTTEDIFVLPGETLAKYTGPAGSEPEERISHRHFETHSNEDAGAEASLAEQNLAEVRGRIREIEARAKAALDSYRSEPEPVVEAPAAPPEVVVVEETLAAAEAAVVEEELTSPAAPTAEPAVEPVAALVVEEEIFIPVLAEAESAAEDDQLSPALDREAATEAGEPEGELEAAVAEMGEESDESADELAETAEEIAEAGEDAEPSTAVVDQEGPEPARIPTSLTAALREQGPRYQHRVSRRSRRKGRDGREGQPRGPVGEATRVPDGRPVERTAPAPRGPVEPRIEKSGVPSISDLLKEGQEIIVQIAKEPLGQKGARITSHIALPGRFLVYMPTVDHIGVSRKIPSDDERLRLKRILQSNRTGIPGGYIVRTAGDGRTEEELRADMMFLYNLWLDMRQKAERRPAPLLVHHDLNVVERILRDQLTSSFKSIWVDNEELYESVLRFVQRFQPAMVTRVKLYTRPNPIFDEFNITSELEKALRPKVWMKSGGYIVINQTEALVAIDVNTGKYVGKSNRLEDTIVKTNTDAIKEIVRQIRLRDLGGIIIVDFIDMDERKNRQKVMQALEEAMRADRAPNKILQFNDFGLVAITRKRVKQSLERTLCTPCPICEGAGYVKNPQTVVGEILTEATKIARAVEGKDVMLRVNPEVAKLLKSNQNSYLQELEEILGRTVIVKSDQQLHPEKFDLA